MWALIHCFHASLSVSNRMRFSYEQSVNIQKDMIKMYVLKVNHFECLFVYEQSQSNTCDGETGVSN